MKLQVGQRLAGTGPVQQPGGYVVTGVVTETPWYGLYAGKKIFYNFDFTNKLLRETDEAEWLDVYLRTIRYPHIDDAAYIHARREGARAEVRRVLGNRFSNLWPEPIDLLEVVNEQDALPASLNADDEDAAEDLEPIVIFARPHGQLLGDWQQTVVPLASLLAVLAELLDFLRQAHAEGLLLQGLGPAAILIDTSDRIHYVGTDMVLESDITSTAPRTQLFPAERWPRGFAAPELFDPTRTPDLRADLYAWGAVSYFLLTGQPPWQIALEQDRPWASFQASHFERLEKSLADIPVDHRRAWAEQLGLGEKGLLTDWPRNLMRMFQALLHADPLRRPGSAEELLQWIEAPPPTPLKAVVAVMAGPGEAKICFDLDGADPGVDIVVRRAVGAPALTPRDGILIEQGPVRTAVADPAVPLTDAAVYYTAFLRKATSTGPIFSTGTIGELLPGTPSALRQFAEAHASAAPADSPIHSQVALCFQAIDHAILGEALLDSPFPLVRSWAISGLSRWGLSNPAIEPEASPAKRLLRRALRDPAPALRVQAARALFANGPAPADDFVLNLMRFMSREDLDEADQALRILRQAGISEDQATRVLDVLEGERPLTCPECHVILPRRERSEHLRSAHGYIEVAGSLLARHAATARLWSVVLEEGNADAHDQLVRVINLTEEKTTRYGAMLEQELSWREPHFAVARDVPGRVKMLAKYAACLRHSSAGRALAPELMRTQSPTIRALGGDLAFSILSGELRGKKPNVRTLRGALARLLPGLPEECIQLCRRLPDAGIEAQVISECLRLLENERLTACSQCNAPVRVGDLETHLRRAHGIHQFRGKRGTFSLVRSLVLDAALGPPADAEAWLALEELARDRHGKDADKRLVTWVCRRLIQLRRKRRAATLSTLASLLAAQTAGIRLLPLLTRRWKEPAVHILARHLALAVASRLPSPVSREIVERILPLLSARELAPDARSETVEALLKTTGREGGEAEELLLAYVALSGKLRAIEKLRRLEKRIGQAPAIGVVCARLEDQVRMDCPRCGAQLRRIDMVRHLWDGHRLLLEGRRVREPWHVLEDWVVDYRLEKEPALLERCRDLASQLDGEAGLARLQQMFLRHGIEDPQALKELVARARQKEAGVCPHCYHLIPLPQHTSPSALVVTDELLEGEGYRLRFSRGWLVPALIADGPDGPIHRGREPGRGLSRRAGSLLLGGVALAVIFGVLLASLGVAMPVPLAMTIALGIDLVFVGLVLFLWPLPRRGRDRLIDAAWKKVVPVLLATKWTGRETGFLGRLAESSRGAGSVRARADAVGMCLAALESWTRQGPAALPAQAALWRLTAADRLAHGDDPVPILVEQAGRSLQGKLPLGYAEALLHDFFVDSGAWGWSRGQIRRLQALLLQQAFAANLTVADLAELARASSILGLALGCNDLDRLAQVHLLWRLRQARPWQKIDAAVTLFDVASVPIEGGASLQTQADLLLLDRQSGIVIGSEGVWFKDVCFSAMPEEVEVRSRGMYGDGFDLMAGPHRFWFPKNPGGLASHLEGWLNFYFRDFLPQLTKHDGPPSEAGRTLLVKNIESCPACKRELVTGIGQIGLAMQTANVTTAAEKEKVEPLAHRSAPSLSRKTSEM